MTNMSFVQAALSLTHSPAARPAVVVLFTAFLVATVTDLRGRRIPNLLTLPVAVIAVLLHGWLGAPLLMLASLVACGVWFLAGICYWAAYNGQGIGAGDVKLVMASAALFGIIPTFWLVLISHSMQLVFLVGFWIHQGTARANLVRAFGWLLLTLTPGTYKLHYRPVGKSDLVPHAPFMLLGAVATISLWGFEVLKF